MKSTNQTKGLYTSQGADEIITNFVNSRFSVTEKDEHGKYTK